ncbi:hypothetical protein ACFL5V_10975 [Fibrobacterota bacterium]
MHLKNMTHRLNKKQKRSREVIGSLKKEIGKLKISEEKKKDLNEQILEISSGGSPPFSLDGLKKQ